MSLPDALPQRFPFVLLDRIVEVQPGVAVTAERTLTHDDPLLDPQGALLPVLLVEAMAQCAGYAAFDPSRRIGGMLVRISRFRCRRGADAGCVLRVNARIVRVFGQTVKARAAVRVGRRVVAAAELTLQLSEYK